MFRPFTLVVAGMMGSTIVSCASVARANGDDDAVLRHLLRGTWAVNSCSGDRVDFNADGTFLNHIHDSGRATGLATVYGRFAIEAGHLVSVPMYDIDVKTGQHLEPDAKERALSLTIRAAGHDVILKNDMVFGEEARRPASATAHRCPAVS